MAKYSAMATSARSPPESRLMLRCRFPGGWAWMSMPQCRASLSSSRASIPLPPPKSWAKVSAKAVRILANSVRKRWSISWVMPSMTPSSACRTASVTGGYVALALACQWLVKEGYLLRSPLRTAVAAVSAGIVDDELLLDLCYEEDSNAQVDLNCIMTEQGELVEIQGTGEGRAFTIQEQRQLVDLCAKGIDELLAKQREALALAEKQAEEGSR